MNTLLTQPTGTQWVSKVFQTMGLPVSIRALVASSEQEIDVTRAARLAMDELHAVDVMFSPFRDDSAISAFAAGDLSWVTLPRLVREVYRECRNAKELTNGKFDAWRDGWFDPTGYVKGWAVERVAMVHLQPLLRQPGVSAIGVNAGGDMQLFTQDDEDFAWTVGIADPGDRCETIATVNVRNGAVATSGTGERGLHIVDPATNKAVQSVCSATVIADRLSTADLWATTAVVAGFDDLQWIHQANLTCGMIVNVDGGVRRWLNDVEVVSTTHAPLLS